MKDVCWGNEYSPSEDIRVPEIIDLHDRLLLQKIKVLFGKESGWPSKGPFRRTWWEVEPLEATLRANLTSLIPPDGYPKMLSVGCAGREAIMLAEKGYLVTGVDVNAADALWTRQNGVEAFVMNMMDLRFPNEVFDAICTSHAQEHGHAPWLQILELFAVLKPNGLLLFIVPPYKEDDWGFNRPDGIHESHSMCLTENQWLSIVQRLGFEVASKRLVGDPTKSGHNAMLLRRQALDEAFPNCRSLLVERLKIGEYYLWPEYRDPRDEGILIDGDWVQPHNRPEG